MFNFVYSSALQDFSELLVCENVIMNFQKRIFSFVYGGSLHLWCFSDLFDHGNLPLWNVLYGQNSAESILGHADLNYRMIEFLSWSYF